MHSAQHWLLTYLLNSLWQVPAIAAAAIVAAKLMVPASWRARHRLFVAALLLAVLLPAWSASTSLPTSGESIAVSILPGGTDGSAATHTQVAAHPRRHFSTSLPLNRPISAAVALLYIAFLLCVAGSLLKKWLATGGLLRHAQPAELDAELAGRWQQWRRSFHVNSVHLLASSRVAGPVTLGFHTAALLVPPGFLARASREEAAAALCHELAHIARCDYLLNLLIEILSLPISYHPACWLLKKQIDESRELACDAMAAAVASGSEVYARSLLSLAQTICAAPAATHTNALGIFEANILEKRIMNLIDRKPTSTPAARVLSGAVASTILAVTCIAISIFTLQPATAQSGSDLKPFLGTWKTTVNGQPAVSVQLMEYQGKLVGSVSNGDFDLDDKNNNAIRGWESHPGGAPIVEASVAGQTLNFKIMDSGGPLPWQLSLSGESKAELSITEPLPNGSKMPALEAVKDDNTTAAVKDDGAPAKDETLHDNAAKPTFKQDMMPALEAEKDDSSPATVKDDGAPAKDETPHDNASRPTFEPDLMPPPHVISSVNPEYTPEARAAKISGICLVGLTIDEGGIPTDVHIVKSLDKGLDENAIKAVQQYRFTPAMKNGVAAAKDVTIEVKFQIY